MTLSAIKRAVCILLVLAFMGQPLLSQEAAVTRAAETSGTVEALIEFHRVIFKMAARNFARRKAQSAIVVAGLMIGTAIISASLVVGDTMRYLFEDGTYHALGEVDEQIYGQSPYGTNQYFSERVFSSLSENLSGVEGIQSLAPAMWSSSG
jgi:hypothetical protein